MTPIFKFFQAKLNYCLTIRENMFTPYFICWLIFLLALLNLWLLLHFHVMLVVKLIKLHYFIVLKKNHRWIGRGLRACYDDDLFDSFMLNLIECLLFTEMLVKGDCFTSSKQKLLTINFYFDSKSLKAPSSFLII